ncbi:MAG: hypothetical protein ACE15C_14370 [Phycisphaerae bacterium]
MTKRSGGYPLTLSVTILATGAVLAWAGLAAGQDAPVSMPASLPGVTQPASEPAKPIVEVSLHNEAQTAPATQPADTAVAKEPIPSPPAATEPDKVPSTGAAATGPAVQPSVALAVKLWQQVRRADAGSSDLADAQRELAEAIKGLSADQRLAAAAALMDDRADEGANAVALGLFGRDALSVEQMRKIMFDPARTQQQRVLLITCYGLLPRRGPAEGQAQTDGLSDGVRRGMIDLLAERIEALSEPGAAEADNYTEQRLVINLCQPALCALAAKAVPETSGAGLAGAMEKFVQARPSGALASAMKGWLAVRTAGATQPAADVPSAMAALGHWDAMARWRAAAFLAQQMEKDAKVADKVLPALDDPRDEVRAAAAMSFAFARTAAPGNQPQRVLTKLTDMLCQDRGVVAQAAAAEALMARADAATIDPLLKMFESRKLGPRRANWLLVVLARLAPRGTDQQRQAILAAAVSEFAQAPRGALEAIGAIGPEAASAKEAVAAYRETASRQDRLFIDGHVLPAINYKPKN